jgi:3-oxoacyl-[acyl-carrier protein] reductase
MVKSSEVVVVTGAGGSGCGRAIACGFAKEGAAVVVSDINDVGGQRTTELIARMGGQAAFCRADVRDEGQVRALVAFTESTFGKVSYSSITLRRLSLRWTGSRAGRRRSRPT